MFLDKFCVLNMKKKKKIQYLLLAQLQWHHTNMFYAGNNVPIVNLKKEKKSNKMKERKISAINFFA